MQKLLSEIRACNTCQSSLPHGVNPVLQAGKNAKLLIIGQAPGSKVHKSGVPWDDASGNQLRKWLGIDKELFYNPEQIALVPMGFCYPGKGSGGDLPPRPECAPLWHKKLLAAMKQVQLTILIGRYAQEYYLADRVKENLTETARAYKEYLPNYLPIPHPSPRNRFWLVKNTWFEQDVVPMLQERVAHVLK